MRISDWSSDVCSSDLLQLMPGSGAERVGQRVQREESRLHHLALVGPGESIADRRKQVTTMRRSGNLLVDDRHQGKVGGDEPGLLEQLAPYGLFRLFARADTAARQGPYPRSIAVPHHQDRLRKGVEDNLTARNRRVAQPQPIVA